MTYFILGIAVLVGVVLAGRWFVTAEPHTVKRALGWTVVALILLIIVVFSVTGRWAWAAAAVPALIPWILRVRLAWRLARMFKAFRQGSRGSSGGAGQSQGASAGMDTALSVDDAWAVLGLEPGAGRQAVIDAHKRLIANLHPDRGGSDYLAARINQAKDILLKLPENQ